MKKSHTLTEHHTPQENFTHMYQAGFGNKWKGRGTDTMSMFLADLDIAPPSCLQQAFLSHIQIHNYGYTAIKALGKDDPLRMIICNHLKKEQNWQVHPSELCFAPGHATYNSCLIEHLIRPNEVLLTLSPEYNAYKDMAKDCYRRDVESRLLEMSDGKQLTYALPSRH